MVTDDCAVSDKETLKNLLTLNLELSEEAAQGVASRVFLSYVPTVIPSGMRPLSDTRHLPYLATHAPPQAREFTCPLAALLSHDEGWSTLVARQAHAGLECTGAIAADTWPVIWCSPCTFGCSMPHNFFLWGKATVCNRTRKDKS